MIRNMLYKKSVPINSKINIIIPSVGEILDNESSYYNMVSAITAMPIDMIAQLDEMGIDFTEIDEYELFLLMFGGIKKNKDTRLIFGDLDLTKFQFALNSETNMPVLIDTEDDIVIDKLIYNKIAMVLREIHQIEKNNKMPGNEDAKKYMIERARKKLQRDRRRNKQEDSHLESLIIAMVNTEQFKYDFEGTRELTIYQFKESVRQVIDKTNYDNRMYGVYSGSIDAKNLSDEDFNWLQHKK